MTTLTRRKALTGAVAKAGAAAISPVVAKTGEHDPIIGLWAKRQRLWAENLKLCDEAAAVEAAAETKGLTPAIQAIEEQMARACRAVYAVDDQIRKHEPQSLSGAAILLRVLAYDCDIEHGADGAKELNAVIAFLEKEGGAS